MNWSRAKNLLLFGLVVTNLLLLGFLYARWDRTRDGTESRAFTRKVLALLEERHIEVKANFPRRAVSLSPLQVEFETKTRDELNRAFFNNEATAEITPTKTVLTRGTEVITLYEDRHFTYERGYDAQGEDLSEKTAEEVAKQFLEERGIATGDMELTAVKPQKEGLLLNFVKLYEGTYVERTSTEVLVDKEGVRSLSRTWLTVLEAVPSSIALPPANRALLTLLDDHRYDGKIVEEIAPCVSFDPGQDAYVVDPTAAQRGRAMPAWRIRFSDQEVLIVSARRG